MLYELNKMDTKKFVTAGKALFTLESGTTGVRYTYKVRISDDKKVWFVSVLTGSDNDGDFSYIGFFRNDFVMRTSSKSKASENAGSVIAFKFFMQHINKIPSKLKIYHSCKCGRCGRTLTTPESIINGIGPECMRMI